LSTETERRAVHVRRAVAIAGQALGTSDLTSDYFAVFGSRWKHGELLESAERMEDRAAWALIALYVIGRDSGILTESADVCEAEDWFRGELRSVLPRISSRLPAEVVAEATWHLRQITYNSDFSELLPYVLEPYGPGSRLSVLKDPGTRAARTSKREKGVFYTPADVAEYMAQQVLTQRGGNPATLTAIDPACGTGVFLRALLRSVTSGPDSVPPLDYASNYLFGIDISPLAVQSACFVLLHECLCAAPQNPIAPWAAWHLLRMNFSAVDALTVRRASGPEEQDLGRQEFHSIRQRLKRDPRSIAEFSGSPPPLRGAHAGLFGLQLRRPTLEAVFPLADGGFDLVIGNPPYAALGSRDDIRELALHFSSVSGEASSGSLQDIDRLLSKGIVFARLG